MEKRGVLTKALAVVGTALVWFPIFATLTTSVVGTIADRVFRFDCLMPAELFPVAFVGGGLLMWAALRARSRRGLIGWGLGVAVGLLLGGVALAALTGVASGETEPAGWFLALLVASIVIYSLALVEIGVAGVSLVRDLFQPGDKGGIPTGPTI